MKCNISAMTWYEYEKSLFFLFCTLYIAYFKTLAFFCIRETHNSHVIANAAEVVYVALSAGFKNNVMFLL